MAMSGTYEEEVHLKGSAKGHFKRFRNENHRFPEAVGHHIQSVNVHEGDWDTHGGIKSWNYTIDGKQEVFKEKREIDDEKMAVTVIGMEGYLMDILKVCEAIFQFIPKSEEGCVCKVTFKWEKRHKDSPEPLNYMKFLTSMVADMDDHILKNENKQT